MADYDKNTPFKEISTAVANYTFDQMGNALTWAYTEDVLFTSNADDTTFYDYVFTLSSV
jgi:hypothetical protein